MNASLLKISLLLISIALAISVVALVAPSNISHPFPQDKYNENPAPALHATNNLSEGHFITKEQAIAKVSVGKEGELKSAEFVTWKQHLANDESKEQLVNTQIDPDRMVWVVKNYFPNGLDTKAGFYEKATLISVFDAQTGQLLESTVMGDWKGQRLP
ncbi:hypothetical protein [Carboxydothermus ferrireducens]|uniref:RND superfamily exporter protein n=1 Tax=Carboxydothermus ferrireducens DSM 11255 TaxID=1119529 RepID=A0ABX2R7E8_9THEO|nr:hypothetical protein [Carboxydothermus ferrireducens]NYE57093.1 putative RND superfamily exporter protein [Carboxydothermus ferrireducens DSM 11255]